ncbi:glycosyltransferase [Flectobacillus roseus]|uniref:glycosyltransferase n=1 Tax=Flectobacillus roseus TaxID=502259 RepID=UPI0024B78D6D|nr:glycosyltransferase [Flectobacillus roseus]MDI9867861.1 glycosyltransferase [Flectobacillus roseus]
MEVDKNTLSNDEKPLVTIWIAARNEEGNIIECLESIHATNFPKNQLQVLIGDDQSSDQTASLVAEYIQDKPYFELISVQKTINAQRGKANVLANLYEHSKGKYFLITDADVKVNPDWIEGMIAGFETNPKLGHQVGVTAVRGQSLWNKYQSIDWLHALTLLRTAALINLPLTGLGNNSGMTRVAYEATGGYAKISFSITEDFALFHEVVMQGYSFKNSINQQVFAETLPMTNLKEFLHQRKRWMVGALQCPWWIVFLLYCQALFLPILIAISCIFSWKVALGLWLIKWLGQTLTVLPTILKLKQIHLIKHLLSYELYANWWQITMVIFYAIPIKIDWKGRIYS